MINTSQAWKDNVYSSTDKKIVFTIGETVLTDSDIQGSVELQETCTNASDIKIGSCISSMLKFNVTNIDQDKNIVNGLSMSVNNMLMIVNELGNKKSIDFLNNEIFVQVGLKIPSTNDYEFISLGIFKADTIDDKDEKVFKITCRDRMKLFDKDCTEFLATRHYPISLFNLLKQLCTFVGIELENTSVVNGNYSIEENFNASDITGQQILCWIGEVAASFININRYGKLVFKTFAPVINNVTDRDYINSDIAKYTVPEITRLQIAVQEDDLGIIVGSGNITYSIINNPLLYTKSSEQLIPVANSILIQLKSIPTYYPVKAYGKGNPAIETGDIFKVLTLKGQEIDVLVMDRKFIYQKQFRDTYESFGTIANGEKKIVNSNIIQSKGKMNILTRTLEMNSLKIVDLEVGYSEIIQTVDSITLTVSNNKTETDGKITTLTTNVSQINQKADSISLSVSQNKTWTEGQFSLVRTDISDINIRADGITSTVSSQGQRIDNNTNQIAVNVQEISRVEQKADSILSTVSIRIDGVVTSVSQVNQKADSIQSTVSTHTGQISQVTQKANSIEARVSNTKVTLTENDGITVTNGGFKIVSSGGLELFKADTNGNVLSRGLYVINPFGQTSNPSISVSQKSILRAIGGWSGEVLIGYNDSSKYHYKESPTGSSLVHTFGGSVDLGGAYDTVKIKGNTVKWETISGKTYLVQA